MPRGRCACQASGRRGAAGNTDNLAAPSPTLDNRRGARRRQGDHHRLGMIGIGNITRGLGSTGRRDTRDHQASHVLQARHIERGIAPMRPTFVCGGPQAIAPIPGAQRGWGDTEPPGHGSHGQAEFGLGIWGAGHGLIVGLPAARRHL